MRERLSQHWRNSNPRRSVAASRPREAAVVCCQASWAEIAGMTEKERVVVVVPVAGMADHGDGLPLDVEERVLMRVVKEASLRRGENVRLLVVPPLRFVTGPAE